MQTLANVAWAYAVMRPADARLFGAVFGAVDAEMRAGRALEGFRPEGSVTHARQLFQAHLAHELATATAVKSVAEAASASPEMSHLMPAAAAVPVACMAPATLAVCRRAWTWNVSRGIRCSKTQLAVLKALRDMKRYTRCEGEK